MPVHKYIPTEIVRHQTNKLSNYERGKNMGKKICICFGRLWLKELYLFFKTAFEVLLTLGVSSAWKKEKNWGSKPVSVQSVFVADLTLFMLKITLL